MTHKSRVCAVLVDTSPQTHEAVSRFWSGALGRELKYSTEERYASLKGPHLDCFVQRVEPGHEGARRVKQVKRWWVMEDPAGHRFCVVPVQSAHWPEGVTEWP